MTFLRGFPDYRGRERYPLGVAPEACGLVVILAVAIAMCLLVLGMRAHAQELGEDFTRLLQKEIWRWQSCPVGAECRQTRVELDDGTVLMWVTGPPEKWRALQAQAEQAQDYDTLRRLRYVGRAGTKRCPENSEAWCQPNVGVPTNCCGEADAYESDDYETDDRGNLYAVLTCNDPKNCEEVIGKVVRKPGEKFRIPADKLLLNHDPVNDTGHGWIWISPSSTDEDGYPVVFCYTPGAGN